MSEEILTSFSEIATSPEAAVTAASAYALALINEPLKDLVGLIGGDRLRQARLDNIERLKKRTFEKLKRDNIEPLAVSLSLAGPILAAAADETREELFDIWTRLLAAALTPNSSHQVRQSFVAAIKQMDPLDAAVMNLLDAKRDDYDNHEIVKQIGCSHDEMYVTVDNLSALELVNKLLGYVDAYGNSTRFRLTHKGRELLRILK